MPRKLTAFAVVLYASLFTAALLAGPNHARVPTAPAVAQTPPPPGEAWRKLIDQTIWPSVYETLFLKPYDPERFWIYELDAVVDGPGDYFGLNQHGDVYVAHVRTLTDLGEHISPGGMPFHFWAAQTGLESGFTLEPLETAGVVVQEGARCAYLPAHFYEHSEGDYEGTDRGCQPPTVSADDCDPFPCDDGGHKFLDQACVDVAGQIFKNSCKAAWGLYDAAVEAATATWNTCIDTAFGISVGCYVASAGVSLITFGVGGVLGAAACTITLNYQLTSCDETLATAKQLARSLRDVSLELALGTFEVNASLCCKDCPEQPKPKDPPKDPGEGGNP